MSKLIWITAAKYIEGYKLHLSFNDGREGILDLKERLYGKFFEPLLDKERFKNFTLNEWTIEWENGADLAPEYLHELCLKQNEEKVHLNI